jgi:hypothetical protein
VRRRATLGAALFVVAAVAAGGWFALGPSPAAPPVTLAPAVSAPQALPIVRARAPREGGARAGNRIAGIVRDASGKPLAGARIGTSDERVELATSDADGRFELAGIGSEPVALYAVLEGYAPARLERVAPESRDVELALPAPARVEGDLTLPAGTREVLVSLCRSPAETSKEQCVARRLFKPPADRYTLERLAPGDYQIVAELGAHPTLRFPVRLNPGEALEGPRLAWP